MARHQELRSEAWDSYVAGRKNMAALQFQHAAQTALDLGDRIAWYECMVLAADSARLSDDYQKALSLLLTARSVEPDDASAYERWLARKLLFSIKFSTGPELGRLRALLDDLRAFSQQQSTPAADVHCAEANIHDLRGEWEDALRCFETAWRVYDGWGYFRSYYAAGAAGCCLRLGQRSPAADWIRAHASADRDPEKRGDVNAKQATLRLWLALASGAAAEELARGLRRYTDRAHRLRGRKDIADQLRELTVRVTMLVPAEGDPAAIDHPARQELRRRWHCTQSVHGHYDARLLLLDYRVACLRHAAGVPPVDDVYYTTPQEVPRSVTAANRDDFAQRLHRARAAAGWAMHYARYLDGLLECEWRQREVRSRIERIEQIQNAAGG